MARAGEDDARELFFSLALDDVREAARLLAPEFERSGGGDGFISFECTPDLADDTAAMVAQATDLWQRQGVAAFCDSYQQLLECVRSKLGEVSVGAP